MKDLRFLDNISVLQSLEDNCFLRFVMRRRGAVRGSKIKIWSIFFSLNVFFACESSDEKDCVKTITIPQIYFINNQSYTIEHTQEVPCSFSEPPDPELIEPPELENFSYEVVSFVFTADTGNNTSRLQFEIKLNNPNDYSVTGVPVLTIRADGFESSRSFSNDASIPCFQIDANSHCILTYDQQSSLELGLINSYELINVQYLLTN